MSQVDGAKDSEAENMAETECRRCAMHIPSRAKVCHHCGRRQAWWAVWVMDEPIGLASLAIAGLALLFTIQGPSVVQDTAKEKVAFAYDNAMEMMGATQKECGSDGRHCNAYGRMAAQYISEFRAALAEQASALSASDYRVFKRREVLLENQEGLMSWNPAAYVRAYNARHGIGVSSKKDVRTELEAD